MSDTVSTNIYPHYTVFLITVTITDEAKALKKKSKKGQTIKDPVRMEIDKLRSELTGEEIKVAVTQPVKETISAGKSLLGLGQRFGSWLGSIIKSQ
jgi:hypothetical protein